MSKYRYADARIGDMVQWEHHLLKVKPNAGHCPDCFFYDKTCSGIACVSEEREEEGNVWYKLIKNLKPENSYYGTIKRKVERPRHGNHIRGRLDRIQANRERAARATQRQKARKLEVLSDKRRKRVKLRGSSLGTRWKFRPRGRYDERFRDADQGVGTDDAA